MDKRQRGSQWVFVAGMFIAALGLIHLAATPVIFPSIALQLFQADQFVFLYMYLSTGTAVVFVGLLTIYSARGLRRAEPWAWTLALATGGFMLLLGVGAVLSMANNPFAYLTLVLALVELTPLWLYRHACQIGNEYRIKEDAA